MLAEFDQIIDKSMGSYKRDYYHQQGVFIGLKKFYSMYNCLVVHMK